MHKSFKDIVFKWIGNSSIHYNSKNPMTMGDLVLTDKFIKPDCFKEYPGTGNFSCAYGYFMMEREIGYYVSSIIKVNFFSGSIMNNKPMNN